MSKPKPKDYFLPPHVDSDPGLVLAPVRDGRALQTIVDGEAIFAALEEAVAAATKSVLIAFWSLDLGLPLFSKAALKGGGKNWLDLLVSVAKRGVLIRVLINDFDPFFFGGGEAHFNAWLNYRVVADIARKGKLSNLQVVCARHGAQIPASSVDLVPGVRLVYPSVAAALNSMDLKPRALHFANSPGLWEVLDWAKDRTVVVRDKDKVFPIFPATHHQKIVLVDGRVAFTGGVNLIPRNRDSRLHTLLDKEENPLAWHDAFLRVEGEPVGDIRDNFIGRWNEERKACETFLATANAAITAVQMPIAATDELDAKRLPLAAADQAKPAFPCQVHRTVSRPPSNWRGVPVLLRQDVLDGYLLAIGMAEEFIYIENQYFRETAIADAIIARHGKQRDLRTLIVLPDVAEELLQGRGDPVTNLGAYLQHGAIEKMQKAIGTSLGFFTMKRPTDAKLVYVHTKVLIVDDVYGNLGSANVNPRSFRTDTELNLAWHDPVTVRNFRTDLWKEQLGSPSGMPSWRPTEYVKQWSAIAAQNVRASAKRRKGYVFPFDNRAKGTPNPLIPDEFT